MSDTDDAQRNHAGTWQDTYSYKLLNKQTWKAHVDAWHICIYEHDDTYTLQILYDVRWKYIYMSILTDRCKYIGIYRYRIHNISNRCTCGEHKQALREMCRYKCTDADTYVCLNENTEIFYR